MSKIEWTNKTWNPIVSGCSMISEGCTNCYAMKMAFRLEQMGQEKYKELTKKTSKGNIVWNGKIKIDMDDKALYEPLKRKNPTIYFVNSMTDLFHEDVPFEAIDKIMAVIALCPQHTFQVLTKRPERMKEYFESGSFLIDREFDNAKIISDVSFPLPNLWLGVSVENQEQANNRIPFLLETPAKVRFLSCEPLLGDIDLELIIVPKGLSLKKELSSLNCLNGKTYHISGYKTGKIDWVIVGGESGRNARPTHPDWVRTIRNHCKKRKNDVPFFFKQWGGKNKKKSGRLLDGIEYNQMPK